MELSKGNWLLAEFIGVKKTDIKDSFNEITYKLPECINDFMHCSHFGYLRFYDSWDWLMCVVDKIESLHPQNNSCTQFRVKISGKSCVILDEFINGTDYEKDFLNLYFNFHDSRRSTVWNACVKFVQWYNLQNI